MILRGRVYPAVTCSVMFIVTQALVDVLGCATTGRHGAVNVENLGHPTGPFLGHDCCHARCCPDRPVIVQ